MIDETRLREIRARAGRLNTAGVAYTAPQAYADVSDLLAFAEAALPILRAVAECEAVRSPVFEPGGIEGIVLHHESRNVLWMREQARALLAGTGEGAEGSEQG